MKTKLALYTSVLALIITGTVYAQEITPSDVIPAEAGIQDDNSIVQESPTPSIVISAELGAVSDSQSEAEIQDHNAPQAHFPEIQEDIPLIIISAPNESSNATSSNATSSNATSTVPDNNFSLDLEDMGTPTAHIFIRNGADVVFDRTVEYTEGEMITVIDVDNVTHSISSNSALALLVNADSASEDLEITKLKFFSFGGYLSCMKVRGEELCENWQYRLNGISPWDSIDNSLIESGDQIGLYFGNPYQIVFSTSTYYIDTPFTAIAKQYNYQDNTWNARTGVTLGIIVPDPNNPWSPIELQTSFVNAQGEAMFTIATSGEYMIGVQEDYYYPSYTITVSSSIATTTATSTDTGGSSGGSTKKTFDVSSAISFIKNLQGSNGSYGGAELYSDWVAIAFGAQGTGDSALKNYLKSKSSIKNILTDNERRAMALLALGENPYTFGGVNYIEAIIKDFDGTQFGERELVNDDIFALIVLSEVGYESDDVEIKKAIEFILKKQNSNGSWESSVDLTSAGIQALLQFESATGVSSAITKAKTFLKNEQESNGGWENVYATSWALQAMRALDESWSKNGNVPEDFLSNEQQTDGGVLNSSSSQSDRIWATSYAIPAVLGKSWNDILRSVSKPKEEISSVNSNSSDDSDDENTATTTTSLIEEVAELEEVATSTLVADVQLLALEDVEEVSEEDPNDETQESITVTGTSNSNEQDSNEEKNTSWISTITSYIAKTISGLVKRIWGLF